MRDWRPKSIPPYEGDVPDQQTMDGSPPVPTIRRSNRHSLASATEYLAMCFADIEGLGIENPKLKQILDVAHAEIQCLNL